MTLPKLHRPSRSPPPTITTLPLGRSGGRDPIFRSPPSTYRELSTSSSVEGKSTSMSSDEYHFSVVAPVHISPALFMRLCSLQVFSDSHAQPLPLSVRTVHPRCPATSAVSTLSCRYILLLLSFCAALRFTCILYDSHPQIRLLAL